ncbi:hypothetical protein [Jiangella asiatica]|uniref:Uncharacterized protein n=1 Tax=Jiangella asiatica TaxID=2530372 RepID=A0A4V2YZY0_9ACTN|nr:hypothetical protein [Jiangella asiatica]TDD98897.1 hypothetical protein E1269_28240 [Jiangella asiatica]
MIEFTVKPDHGEPFDITAASRDVFLWEKAYRGAAFSNLRGGGTMTELYQLAHTACRRQGMFAGSLDEFADTHDLAFEEDQDDEPDPTQPDHSPDE